MQRFLRSWSRHFTVLFLTGLILVIALNSFQSVLGQTTPEIHAQTNPKNRHQEDVTQSRPVPDSVLPCVPSPPVVTKVAEWGRWQQGETTYFYLAAYNETLPKRGDDLVIRQRAKDCERVHFFPTEVLPLAHSLPTPVARNLRLQRYELWVEAHSPAELQAQVNAATAGQETVLWWDEEVWALQQLGIEIPENVIVESAND